MRFIFRSCSLHVARIVGVAFALMMTAGAASAMPVFIYSFNQTVPSNLSVYGTITVDCTGPCTLSAMDFYIQASGPNAVNLSEAYGSTPGIIADTVSNTIQFNDPLLFTPVESLVVDPVSGELIDFIAAWRDGDAGVAFTSPNVMGGGGVAGFGVLACGFEVDSSNDPRPNAVCGDTLRMISTGQKIPFDTEEGAFKSGNWTQVPAPASLWLLLGALGALAGVARARRSSLS